MDLGPHTHGGLIGGVVTATTAGVQEVEVMEVDMDLDMEVAMD